MSENQTWNDTLREEIRETLRSIILGEIRLANSCYEDILQTCREAYIEDECPKCEWDVFIQFSVDEIKQASAKHIVEQVSWHGETDCDRLDAVEATLRERDILLWQVSPCCDPCTRAELPERIDEIDRQYPGFRDRVRGYAFFIDQDMAEMLAESTKLSVYLAYGWFSPDDSHVAPDIYKQNALKVAHDVCDCLLEHGLEPNWNGSLSKKIGISLNWQRRTILLG